jgi:hypothetical protein
MQTVDRLKAQQAFACLTWARPFQLKLAAWRQRSAGGTVAANEAPPTCMLLQYFYPCLGMLCDPPTRFSAAAAAPAAAAAAAAAGLG